MTVKFCFCWGGSDGDDDGDDDGPRDHKNHDDDDDRGFRESRKEYE